MRHLYSLALGFVLVAMVIGSSSDARAAPETFNSALPVAEGDFIFREQLLAIKANDDPSPADRNLEILGGVSVLGYGVTSDLAIFGMLPWLDKQIDLTMPSGQRITRRTNGIGDAQVFARYTIFQKNLPGRSIRIAPFVGVKMPTGDADDRDSLGRLPPPLQSGSGSWDPLGGVIATWQTLNYEIDGQLSYKANTRANGFKFGDEFEADASMQYRLWPRKLTGGVPGFLNGVIETNLSHQAKNEIAGISDPDSGGTKLLLSPGLQYVTKKWVVEAVVQLPVVQDLNGTALKDDYAVRAGFRVNF